MATLNTFFRCEAAGRSNNEDNGKILDLGSKGTLLVVCDGMGGMEAGEVASSLAVATIEKWFEPDQLVETVMNDPMPYLQQAIIGADNNIKNYTKTHPETEGMGSTIVMAWLIEKKVYVAWCGDSRAYRYNPQTGLERLSRDHSLVQTWVDAGQITEEQAFNHPKGNIITRSLGDPNGQALPEVNENTLYNGDVLLLCSDGLCGTLRDSEIEAILQREEGLEACGNALWKADEEAEWHDNVTTAMAQVVSGGNIISAAAKAVEEPGEIEIVEEEEPKRKGANSKTGQYIKYVGILIGLILGVVVTMLIMKPSAENKPLKQDVEVSSRQGKHDKLDKQDKQDKQEPKVTENKETEKTEEETTQPANLDENAEPGKGNSETTTTAAQESGVQDSNLPEK